MGGKEQISKLLPCVYKWSSVVCIHQCIPQHILWTMMQSGIQKEVKNKNYIYNE